MNHSEYLNLPENELHKNIYLMEWRKLFIGLFSLPGPTSLIPEYAYQTLDSLLFELLDLVPEEEKAPIRQARKIISTVNINKEIPLKLEKLKELEKVRVEILKIRWEKS